MDQQVTPDEKIVGSGDDALIDEDIERLAIALAALLAAWARARSHIHALRER
jgi:hypothetical protein